MLSPAETVMVCSVFQVEVEKVRVCVSPSVPPCLLTVRPAGAVTVMVTSLAGRASRLTV